MSVARAGAHRAAGAPRSIESATATRSIGAASVGGVVAAARRPRCSSRAPSRQVVGVPSARRGGADGTDLAAIRDHAAQQLTRFKVPRYIEAVEELPHTPTGRVAKHELPRERTPDEHDFDTTGRA